MIQILSTLYNASNYIERSVNSLLNQTITDWKCYITDDLSTDGTTSYVEALIESDNRFELIVNKKKMWQPGNYYQILKKEEIKELDICVTLDMDDWLADNYVLERITKEYQDENLWLTYGQYEQWLGDGQTYKGSCSEPDFNNLRGFNDWTISHLRTYRAFLFREIKQEDLIAPSGEYWETTGDVSFMLPMIEMAGKKHSKFLSEINYIYNVQNPLNDFKQKVSQQLSYRELIKKKKPYKQID